MVCMGHRPQYETPHFTKHKFPVCAARNVQTHQINCSMSAHVNEGGKILISILLAPHMLLRGAVPMLVAMHNDVLCWNESSDVVL